MTTPKMDLGGPGSPWEFQVFVDKARAFDIADSLTEVVFETPDPVKGTVQLRMKKETAIALRNSLNTMLAKPPLETTLHRCTDVNCSHHSHR